ncbi:MAG TPA: S-methyl-5-thioribose kinase [Candidatus Mediterraneibacter surreyensis]|nr:S-methyl-5-thioribose kinase [Candidatus Mediterraneibacter surreyensis]
MGRFDKYFLMECDDVVEYVKEKYDFFDKNAELSVNEIGDGNLNYVFRVQDEKTGKSVILKHSGIETRARSGRHVDTDRNRIEAEILMLQDRYAPGYVPKIYGYDPVMCCMAMEDMKDYEVMRGALLKYERYPFFADQITTYMVNILLATTDVAMDHKEKKKLVKSYINPDLCTITEQLVYSDSFGNFAGKNYVVDELKDYVEQEIYGDKELRLEGAKLKFDFMEHAQALIHGDLHSGSIFINNERIKVFDPEFAFYGPMGYDLANVVAHTIFAKFHSIAMQEEGNAKNEFQEWADSVILESVDLFIDKFKEKYDEICTDCMAKTEGFREYYLGQVIHDAAGIAGCELIRRIVGVSKVKDITDITDSALRAEQEKKMISIAKELIKRRNEIFDGKQFLEIVKKNV